VVQNDVRLWKDAEKFNPSRFIEREKTNSGASAMANPNDLSRFDFLPFGHGRYSCPGNVFAMNEMLLFLSMMFHNFAMRLVNAIPSADNTKLVTALS
jgi:cytochrome P450